MKYSLLGALFAGLVATAVSAAPADTAKIVARCETCHGPKGDSKSVDVPRLNGQPVEYLVGRLWAFLNVTNQTPHATSAMWQTVTDLSDSDKRTVADYFARQAPPAFHPAPQTSAGKALYLNGAPKQGLASCQSCHGANGEGKGAAPRLAGQHTAYLKTQMWALNFTLRDHPAMQPNAGRLSADEIDALAAYLGTD